MNELCSPNEDCLCIVTAPEADAAGIGDFLRTTPVPVKKLTQAKVLSGVF